MPRWLWLILCVLLLLFGWLAFHAPESLPTSGEIQGCPLPEKYLRADTPLQSNIDKRIAVIQRGDASLIPLAGLSLQARVLGRENYYFGDEAEFSPMDLALGWGSMSDPGMSKKLDIDQSGRWYNYRWSSDGPPIPLEEIISHSANMHMVPANSTVANSLEKISANDLIELNGWLIRIEKKNGWRWQSSLSREDSGNGACELVYVCSVDVKK